MKQDEEHAICSSCSGDLLATLQWAGHQFSFTSVPHTYRKFAANILANQQNLIVIFASDGFLINEIPSFNFYNILSENKSYDKLFLRDMKRNYYMDGLGKTTKNFYETISFIKTTISKKKYKNVFSLGSSSGGFAAILFGNILKFRKVLAFNPQTVLSKEKELEIKDFYFANRASKELRAKNNSDKYFQNCLNLKKLIPFTTRVEIHYSGLSQIDKNYANHIKHPNCVLIEYQSSSHLLAYQLRESGKLKSIILDSLEI